LRRQAGGTETPTEAVDACEEIPVMNELLLPVLIFAGIVGVFVALIGARIGSMEQRLLALSRLEGKLDALLKQQGISFDPYADTPPAVLDALRRGRTIEAIKAYRLATGVGLKEAKDYVDELRRRSGPNV
jgi:hypothetical protein